MPTINADQHDLMKNYHKPQDEKRMIIVLPRGAFTAWLTCPSSEMMGFMQPFAADRFKTHPISP